MKWEIMKIKQFRIDMHDNHNEIEIDVSMDLSKDKIEGVSIWFNSEERIDVEMKVNKDNINSLKHLIFQINPDVGIMETWNMSYNIDEVEK